MIDHSVLGQPPSDPVTRVAQLQMIRIGSNLPPAKSVEQDLDRARQVLQRCSVGGLLLFNGRWPETAESLAKLQRDSDIPLLVGADIERGVGQQVHGLTLYPHQMAFSQLSDGAESVKRFARSLATEAQAAGIHIAFGPVADAATDVRNPIIATRSFAAEPTRCGELSTAMVSAAEAAGLATTVKHFPGHGDTQGDSHDALPVVNKSRAELDACEIVPFRAAIDAGCSLVMTAHVSYPALDPTGTCATLSRPILTNLLRGELGFRGVVCSDSLLMAGAKQGFAHEGEMAAAAILAGVDLLLDVADPLAVTEYLVTRIATDLLLAQRIDEALERVWRLKRRVFAAGPSEPLTDGLRDAFRTDAIRAASGAIKLVDGSAPPQLRADVPTAVVMLRPFTTPLDPPEQPLGAAVRKAFAKVEYYELAPQSSLAEYAVAAEACRVADQVVIAMVVKPAAWQVFGLLASQRLWVHEVLASSQAVLVSLGVEAALAEFPSAAARICTFSDVPASQIALAESLVAMEISA